MHIHFLFNSPLHSTSGADPSSLVIPAIGGIGAIFYGLWLVLYPDRCYQRLEHRLNVLESNPYNFDPIRLSNKKRVLGDYVYANNPIEKIRLTGWRYIVFASLFELLLLGILFYLQRIH